MSVAYNGFTFNDYSHVKVDAEMHYDDADRTIVYHKYKVRIDTTIYAEDNDPTVGHNFRRIRQLLSKAGQELEVDIEGFGPTLVVNGPSAGDPKDSAWGPKPRVISWEPVGANNSVEVTWECEFCMPTCEGAGGVRFTGLSALNYTVSWSIVRGYTTRTTSGYLEIAMTRVNGGRTLPDTADAYRDVIIIPKPYNFERTTQWTLSSDKRRADFTITDMEIQSPNPYPPGVMSIRANHRVAWSRKALATLPNVISATISLTHGQPRGKAWDIFRLICSARIGVALANSKVFLESLDVDESLYDNSTSFSLTYRLYFAPGQSALGQIFASTGLFDLTPGDWTSNGVLREQYETHRGIAGMTHNPSEDQIIDLCANVILPSTPSPTNPPPYTPTTYVKFCNAKPVPYESWLRFEGAFSSVEDNPVVEQVTVGEDDLQTRDFDPNDPTGTIGDTDAAKNIKRFIESAPAGMEFEWLGYAERVGYDIPKPGKLKFGNVTLVRKGKGIFRKKFLGTHFCQKVYGAAWKYRYVVDSRPPFVNADESDPINAPGAP